MYIYINENSNINTFLVRTSFTRKIIKNLFMNSVQDKQPKLSQICWQQSSVKMFCYIWQVTILANLGTYIYTEFLSIYTGPSYSNFLSRLSYDEQ